MREIAKTIQYELTPEEQLDGVMLESAIRLLTYNGEWMVVSQTPKHRMQFDANYNRYYATVIYHRTS